VSYVRVQLAAAAAVGQVEQAVAQGLPALAQLVQSQALLSPGLQEVQQLPRLTEQPLAVPGEQTQAMEDLVDTQVARPAAPASSSSVTAMRTPFPTPAVA